jgi:hypothetical protein
LFQFRNFAIILKFVKYITPPFLIFPWHRIESNYRCQFN